LLKRLPDYQPNVDTRFSESLEVKDFSSVDSKSHGSSSFLLLRNDCSPNQLNHSLNYSQTPGKILPHLNNSFNPNPYAREQEHHAITSNQRIVSTKLKIDKIKNIKKVIESNVNTIQESKPIIVAKWQPPLPK